MLEQVVSVDPLIVPAVETTDQHDIPREHLRSTGLQLVLQCLFSGKIVAWLVCTATCKPRTRLAPRVAFYDSVMQGFIVTATGEHRVQIERPVTVIGDGGPLPRCYRGGGEGLIAGHGGEMARRRLAGCRTRSGQRHGGLPAAAGLGGDGRHVNAPSISSRPLNRVSAS